MSKCRLFFQLHIILAYHSWHSVGVVGGSVVVVGGSVVVVGDFVVAGIGGISILNLLRRLPLDQPSVEVINAAKRAMIIKVQISFAIFTLKLKLKSMLIASKPRIKQ